MRGALYWALAGIFAALCALVWHNHDVKTKVEAAIKATNDARDARDLAAVNKANQAVRARETAAYRTNEIQEANRAAEKDRLAAAESALAATSGRLRDAIDAARDRGRQPSDVPHAGRSACDTAVPLELFRDAAGQAERMGQEAGRLAQQVAGLQQYGQACFQLTNPQAQSLPERHDVEKIAPEGAPKH